MNFQLRKPEMTHGGMREIVHLHHADMVAGPGLAPTDICKSSTKLLLLCTKSILRLQDVCYWTSLVILSSFPSMQCSWVLVQNLANVNEYLSAADWYFENIFWKCIFRRRKLLGSCIEKTLVKQECHGWDLWQFSCPQPSLEEWIDVTHLSPALQGW